MKGKNMFQLTDSVIAIENPSFSLKLVENGKTFTTAELHSSFARGQEYADWKPALEAIVAKAIHDFLDDGDTYEAKYVGFNPSFDTSYVQDDGATRVLGMYEVNDDTGEETHLGNVLSTNVSAMRDSAFYALSEAANAADTTVEQLNELLEQLQTHRHHIAVLGANVDDLTLEVNEALMWSDWEFVDFEFRHVNDPAFLSSLADRISIVGAELGSEADFGGLCIAFDIAVDGNSVYSTVEWLDDDLDLVADDCHLDFNRGHIDAVRDALGDDWERYNELSASARDGAVYEVDVVIQEKLVDAVAALKAERSAA